MSSKLDKSLEEITGSRGRGGQGRSRRTGKPAAQVVGGVAKNKAAPRGPRASAAAAPVAAPLQTRGDSKIIVSNLPDDVNEQQIKEYFTSTVGQVKKVLLNYTKNGKSIGVANITFSQPQSAAEAAKAYDGVKVDGRPMKIEVVMGAKFVPAPPPAKTLGDRIQAPKAAKVNPKKAAATTAKPATARPNAATAGASSRGRGRGGRRSGPGRQKKKTAEELDADMADYFVPNTNGAAPAAATNGATTTQAAPNGGEATMEDEIM